MYCYQLPEEQICCSANTSCDVRDTTSTYVLYTWGLGLSLHVVGLTKGVT